jgi:hypothetical protein
LYSFNTNCEQDIGTKSVMHTPTVKMGVKWAASRGY